MSCKNIVGQQRALNMLQGTLITGRVAAAYLFIGAKGVGKYTAALEFAKALNCETRREADSCDDCGSCRKTGAFKHPDVIVISPEDDLITVEQIRNVEEFLSFMPYEGRKKVVIVDDADMMNIYSENAFLKTLEEPPDDSVVILVSSRPDVLADTVRSRCLKIGFSHLSEAELRAAAGAAGRPDVTDTKLRLAMGSAGQLFDDEMIEKRDEALGVFEDMVAGKEIAAPKDRREVEELIDRFSLFIRDMAIHVSSGRDDDLINVDSSDRIAGLCKECDLKVIINTYKLLAELRQRMRYNLNRSVVINYLSSLLSVMRRGKNFSP